MAEPLALFACRSYYSLLRGAVSPARLVEQAAAYGYAGIAMPDVNGFYGLTEFYQVAQKAGIIPIVGAELLCDGITPEEPSRRVVLLAENRHGYHQLCRLLSQRHLDDGFDLWEALPEHIEGIIAIGYDHIILEKLRTIFSAECLYAGCGVSVDAAWAKRNGFQPLACRTINVITADDCNTQDILARIRSRSSEGSGPDDQCGHVPLPLPEQLRQEFQFHPEALSNTLVLAERCQFDLIGDRYWLPKINAQGYRDSHQKLSRLCHLGLVKQYGKIKHAIVKRLSHELQVIRENHFCDYFLVVHEIIAYARQHNIPVDVRGSAAGALVTYALGLTRVCPVENDLYFERFMNPGRKDCPDIDIDLCWRRRDDVIQFCYDHWGHDRVAMVCTINRYRRRGALRDVGRVLNLHPDQITEMVEHPHGQGHEYSSITQLAQQIIGVPRHLGVHCGGLIITPRPIMELSPLQRATKGIVVTQYDKNAAEDLKLIKMDLLGNRSLSTVHEAIEIIHQQKDHAPLDIDAIDPQDHRTACLLTAGDGLGIFQSESPAMRQLTQALRVSSRREIAIALSLIRPGPASGGTKQEYIERHVHRKPYTFLHPKLAQVLGDTHGVMLYQEDVMRIAVELAGYTVAQANQFRSEVSKPVSSRTLNEQYHDFVYRRAVEVGIDRDTAEAIWEQLLKFAAYSFCKAHATVYGNIAWQTAYLKAHHPVAFFGSLLRNHQGMYPLRVYVWDAIRHGLDVRGIHVNHSDIEWTVQDGGIIQAGFNLIGGFTVTTMQQIVEQREQGLFASLDDLRQRVTFRKGELAALIRIGACDGLGPSRPAMLDALQYPVYGPRQEFLFDPNAPEDNTPQREFSPIERLQAELELTGIPLTMHPAALIQGQFVRAANLHKHIGQTVTVVGYLAAARTTRTHDGKRMAFVTLEDETGLTEINFFPDRIDAYDHIRRAGTAVWVTGKVVEHLTCTILEAHTAGLVHPNSDRQRYVS